MDGSYSSPLSHPLKRNRQKRDLADLEALGEKKLLDFLIYILYILIVQYRLSWEIIMDTIAVSDLRANLMKILKQIEHGSEVDITSRGKVVAKLVPPDYTRKIAKKKLKKLGKNAVLGDIISPIDVQWKAFQK